MAESNEVLFPINGVDVAGEFSAQRPGTCPTATNVRARDPLLDRLRGGSRPGLIKYPAQQIPEGAELIQHLAQIVLFNADYLLATFEDFEPDFVNDPSTNNLANRQPVGAVRKIPLYGSGVTPNRNRPVNPRRRVSVVASVTEQSNGESVTLTATLTRQTAGTNVAGATIRLNTLPPGRDGDGDTTVTNGSGVGTFTVTEESFEKSVRYYVSNEYTVP